MGHLHARASPPAHEALHLRAPSVISLKEGRTSFLYCPTTPAQAPRRPCRLSPWCTARPPHVRTLLPAEPVASQRRRGGKRPCTAAALAPAALELQPAVR